MGLGNPPAGLDLVLGLERLNGLAFHEPADLVAAAEAGMTIDAFRGELARHGQTLPLEFPLSSRATVGGVLAANAGGPSRLAFGGLRDWLIGLKVVSASGDITKSGGRVVKNVTGYDLNKLYTGSLGTLGVIVEATFKVTPLPAAKGTVTASVGSLEAAVELSQGVLALPGRPQALQVIDKGAVDRLPDLGTPRGAAVVAALFSGSEPSVGRKVSQAAEVLAAGGARNVATLMNEEGDEVWRSITDLGWDGEGGPQADGEGWASTLPRGHLRGFHGRQPDPSAQGHRSRSGQWPGPGAGVGGGAGAPGRPDGRGDYQDGSPGRGDLWWVRRHRAMPPGVETQDGRVGRRGGGPGPDAAGQEGDGPQGHTQSGPVRRGDMRTPA